jgi:putative hydrolase of the HAD superfamily
MFEALIFDLDNTLLDRLSAQRRWSEKFATRWLESATKEAIDGAVEDLMTLDAYGYISREEFGEGVLQRFPQWIPGEGDRSVDHSARRAAFLVEYRQKLISFYPRHEAVCDLVERLGQSYRLGVVSNGRVSSQWPKMERAGLDAGFVAVVISEEVGFEKPHPEPFLSALRALDVAAEKSLYIGDNPGHDIAGAAAVGMKTCWVALGRRFSDDRVKPDLIIDSVLELETVLSEKIPPRPLSP